MKKLLTLLCSTLLGLTFFVNAESTTKEVHWLTNYEEAVNLSKSSSKPIILFFTGSDWCGWCTKLEQESLDTPDFARAAGDKFIFVKLDFPLNTTLPPHIASQNKELQKKFNIRGFPAIVILESKNQSQIGATGYRPGGGKLYADHLLKFVNDYSNYQQKLQKVDSQKFSSADLKKLYETAQANGHYNDLNRIIKAGEASEDSQFFMLERYRLLVNEGHVGSEEALTLKNQLIVKDPLNEKMTHYHLAVIDFESREMDKEKRSADQAVAPLTHYVENFGQQDKEHLWRIQMIISQVYFDKNSLMEALKFAEKSYNAAPASAKAEISLAIKSIQAQLSKSETAFNK